MYLIDGEMIMGAVAFSPFEFKTPDSDKQNVPILLSKLLLSNQKFTLMSSKPKLGNYT